MATVNAVLLIFLQWVGYLLIFAIALHLVAHYAKEVIAHHHKIKGTIAMTLAAQAQGDNAAFNGLLDAVRAHKEAARAQPDGAKR